MGWGKDQSLEGVIQGWITWVTLFGGDHGVVWVSKKFTFWDADIGPSGKLSPEGLLCVTAKNFLVSLSCLLGPLRPGKVFLFSSIPFIPLGGGLC